MASPATGSNSRLISPDSEYENHAHHPTAPDSSGERRLAVRRWLPDPQKRWTQNSNATLERVIPVIFLPGIMGSNLRMSPARQTQLNQKNNIAWRPDNKFSWALPMTTKDARVRQLQLDPLTTVVDVHDPKNNPTGNAKEDADDRHDNVSVTAETPLLRTDPATSKPRTSAKQKARARGWSEIMFSSYGDLLNHLEARLNLAFSNGKLNPDWKDIVGADPAKMATGGQKRAAPF